MTRPAVPSRVWRDRAQMAEGAENAARERADMRQASREAAMYPDPYREGYVTEKAEAYRRLADVHAVHARIYRNAYESALEAELAERRWSA